MGRLLRDRTSRFSRSREITLASLDDVSLAIGVLQARMDGMDKEMSEMKEIVSDLRNIVYEIRDLANMGRGGWVVLVRQGAIITALMGIGAAGVTLWKHLWP